MRTQDEILERFTRLRAGGEDLFGFRQEALLTAMTLETAERTGVLTDSVDRSKWTEPDVAGTARSYLLFAVEKAVNHRGLSAGRSIEKLEEWVWCLGDETLLNHFVDAPYPQYGVPKLQLLVEAWGMHDDMLDQLTRCDFRLESWQSMARGDVCVSLCDRGCGV